MDQQLRKNIQSERINPYTGIGSSTEQTEETEENEGSSCIETALSKLDLDQWSDNQLRCSQYGCFACGSLSIGAGIGGFMTAINLISNPALSIIAAFGILGVCPCSGATCVYYCTKPCTLKRLELLEKHEQLEREKEVIARYRHKRTKQNPNQS